MKKLIADYFRGMLAIIQITIFIPFCLQSKNAKIKIYRTYKSAYCFVLQTSNLVSHIKRRRYNESV
jgi:hypothetical protein